MVELKFGSKLQNGKYEIVKVLGSGNFGITYLATTKIAVNGQLGQMDVTVNVAIKEFYMKDLNNRTSDGSSVEGTHNTMVKNYRQKFRKEAENLAKLHHPNIVKVIEVFDENNTTYYVMEYVEGGTLDDYIKSKGRLTEEEALQCTLEIADALSYMHKNMMIHLDLKPKNIMRNSKGHLYLIDFGLSKQYDENGEPESSTSIGLGTPGYAPLEQASYKQDGTLPVTLDVYALGASLFKMLTGKTPPESSAILNDGLPLSSLQKVGISANTISIVEKAMAPIKKDRYQRVADLSKAISILSLNDEKTIIEDEEEGTTIEPEKEQIAQTALSRPKPESSNNRPPTDLSTRILVAAIVAAALFFLGLLAFVFMRNGSSNSNEQRVIEVTDSIEYALEDSELVQNSHNTTIQKPSQDKRETAEMPNRSPQEKRPNAPVNKELIMPTTTKEPSDTFITNKQHTEPEDNRIYEVVESSAQFPGGDGACYSWIASNLRYPALAQEQGIQGRVFVQFVVEKDGSLTNITILRSPDPSFSKEAERVVKAMPRWTPASQKGRIVRSRYNLPIMFRLL